MDQVGRFRPGFLDHLSQTAGVVKQRARAKLVAVERLVAAVLHEQRGAVRLQQSFVFDVAVRVVDERARLDVAVRVDMQVAAAARDAAVHILAVVPEVHGENRLRPAELADLVVHELALVCGRNQVCHGVYPYGHICEHPCELAALVNQKIEILVAADILGIFAGIAQRGAERQLFRPQELHGAQHGLVGALAAAGIGLLFVALDADGRHEVLDPQHVVGEFFVDQRAVRKGEEHAVVVLLAQADDVVLADHRLPAREDIHKGAQFLALLHDVVHLLEAEVQPMAVFCRPAADAVQVARRGRVEQDGPRNVAVVFFDDLVFAAAAEDAGVDEEVLEQLLAHALVDVGVKAADQPVPVVVRVLHEAVDHVVSVCKIIIPVKFTKPADKLRHVLLRVAVKVRQHPLQAEGLQLFSHRGTHIVILLFQKNYRDTRLYVSFRITWFREFVSIQFLLKVKILYRIRKVSQDRNHPRPDVRGRRFGLTGTPLYCMI